MKRGAIVAASLVALLLVYLLGSYGTLSPCGMLKKDVQATLLRHSDQSSGPAALGTAMALALAGPMIDAHLAALGPTDCARALVRLHTGGDNPFAGLSRPPSVVRRKPPLDWKKELKVRKSQFTVDHGFAQFKGEVENVGQHTIRSLKVNVFFYDTKQREIGQKADAIIYSFSDPMRPGYVKPFNVLTEATSGLSQIRYSFHIEEYE